MSVRGIRGATVIDEDQADTVITATQELLEAIKSANPSLSPDEIACIFFTVTEDIRSAYPAKAARIMGWQAVPMLCAHEIPVPGGLPRCIRLLIQWNTDLPQSAIRHVYLHAAIELRPDWVNPIVNINDELKLRRNEL
jgi:chorismate mutase